jgi:predicted O-methyltransferase YrrM
MNGIPEANSRFDSTTEPAYPHLEFAEAWTRLQQFDWSDPEIEEFLGRCGTSLPDYFRQSHTGGLDLQQVPSEFAKLIRYIWREHPALEDYIEIGIGKGGSFMVLVQALRSKGINPSLVVADNLSYATEPQRERLNFLQAHYKLEAFIGDTSRPEFQNFLTGRTFDLIFIDGDHSFQGCLSDFVLMLSRLKPGGSMVFHDIASGSCPGVGDVFAFARKFFRHSELFVDSGSCGIGVLRGPLCASIPHGALTRLKVQQLARDVARASLSLITKWSGRVSRKLGKFC